VASRERASKFVAARRETIFGARRALRQLAVTQCGRLSRNRRSRRLPCAHAVIAKTLVDQASALIKVLETRHIRAVRKL
jgi:hypothetical protein